MANINNIDNINNIYNIDYINNINNIDNIDNINNIDNIDNINNINNINNYNLLPLFESVEEQEEFIGNEQELFNVLINNENFNSNNTQFLVNNNYNYYWREGLLLDLNNPDFDLRDVIDIEYIYDSDENNKGDYSLLLYMIRYIDNFDVNTFVNVLLNTFDLEDRMNIYQIGNIRLPQN